MSLNFNQLLRVKKAKKAGGKCKCGSSQTYRELLSFCSAARKKEGPQRHTKRRDQECENRRAYDKVVHMEVETVMPPSNAYACDSMARSSASNATPVKKGTLVVGIIIIDTLPHEEIWKSWANEAGKVTMRPQTI